MSTPAGVRWCRWCNEEHAADFMCEKALSALKDLANLGVGTKPMHHLPADATLEDLGVDRGSVEILGGIGFDGGAVQVGDEWHVMLIVQSEDPDGKKHPARILITSVDGFERLREWTVEVFDQTIARTRKLNEEAT